MDDIGLRQLNREGAAGAEWRALLRKEGIQEDPHLDYTVGAYDRRGRLIGTGSCFRNTLRCFAVDDSHRGEGLLNRIVTHLMEYQYARGNCRLFLHTKCANFPIFRELGFYEIARVEGKVVFMENRPHGFECYLRHLERGRGRQAAIVMNANPFTMGHRRLVETASRENDTVHLFVVSEDVSQFSFSVRKQLVEEGTRDLENVVYHATESYLISTAVFPSYFFPASEEVTRIQAELDCKVFLRIAEALHITARYVGQEPFSPTTAIYNENLCRLLPAGGVNYREVPRFDTDGEVISASKVREIIKRPAVNREALSRLLPPSTLQYLAGARLI